MAVDAPLVERGGRSDFGFGDRLTYEPLKPDRLLKDGDTVELGGSRLTAVLTPGHTRGCTTWTAKVDENGKRYDVVFFCSTSVPGYRLAGKPAYSGIVEDYRASFRRVASLSCDVFLAAHASFFDQEGKRERLAKDPRVNPFIDPDEMRRHVEESRKAFEAELSRQMREPSD